MSKTVKIVAGVALLAVAPHLGSKVLLKTFVQSMGSSLLLAGAGELLASSPQATELQAGHKQPIMNSVDSQKLVYGTARVGGAEVYVEEYDTGANELSNDTIVFARVVADKPVNGFGTFWLGDKEISYDASGTVTTEPYAGHLWVKFYDGNQTAADPWLMESNAVFTNDFVGMGKAYFVVKAVFDADVFPYGLSELRQASVEVFGHNLYDPISETTVQAGNNAALVIYDYLTDTVVGPGIPQNEINFDALSAAITKCNETVPAANGENVSRYTIDGVIDSAENVPAILRTLLTAMAGSHVYRCGQFYLYAGEPVLAHTVLDEDSIISISTSAKGQGRSGYNSVSGLFVSPGHGYETIEYPSLSRVAYLAEDGGETRHLSLSLPYTKDHRTAQRISKIYLERSRQPQAVVNALPSALACPAQAGVALDWANFGWSGKCFVVQSSQVITDFEEGMGVNLILRGEDASVYDWVIGEEQQLFQENVTAGGTPHRTVPVHNLAVEAGLEADDQGNEQPVMIASWHGPGNLVKRTVVQWRIDEGPYKIAGSFDYEAGSHHLAQSLSFWVPGGQLIQVRVAHVMANGKDTIGAFETHAPVLSLPANNITNIDNGLIDAAGNSLQDIDLVAASMFDPAYLWDFHDNDLDWTMHGAGSFVFTGTSLAINGTEGDAQIISPEGLTLSGGENPIIYLRMKRTVSNGNSFEYSKIYYRSRGETFSESNSLRARRSFVTGTYITYAFDMRESTGNWTTSEIHQVRFDPSGQSGDSFEVDWIAVGRIKPNSGMSDANLVDTLAMVVVGEADTSSDVNIGTISLNDVGLSPGDQISAGLYVSSTGSRRGRIGFNVRDGNQTILKIPNGDWANNGLSVIEGFILPDDAVDIVFKAERENSGSGAVGHSMLNLLRAPNLKTLRVTRSDVEANANRVTDTNQLTDSANHAGTADWDGVSGGGKPADNATKNDGALADLDTVDTDEVEDEAVTDFVSGTGGAGSYALSSTNTQEDLYSVTVPGNPNGYKIFAKCNLRNTDGLDHELSIGLYRTDGGYNNAIGVTMQPVSANTRKYVVVALTEGFTGNREYSFSIRWRGTAQNITAGDATIKLEGAKK